MVLAIGLVVDDAIVVVENVHRHIEEGKGRMEAALMGARELALPIVAMTTTLVAVYAPIGFMGGLVGSLFTEFAFSLAGAVLISGVVALTLSPMISARVLKAHGQQGRFEVAVERFFTGLANGYRRLLHASLDTPSVTLVFGAVILASIYLLFVTSKSELAPTEDQSILFFQAVAPQTATAEYNSLYARQVLDIFESVPEYHESFVLVGFGGDPTVTFGGFKMEPPSQRERSQMQVQPEIQGKLQQVAGFQMAVFPRPSLPGGGRGLPMQFVLVSDADYETLDQLAGQLIGKAMGSGNFMFLRKSINFNRPRLHMLIDRDRAGVLGVSMQEIAQGLATLVGDGYINRFSLAGRSYKVIPQVEQDFRVSDERLADYHVRSVSGELIPLSNLVRFEQRVEPSKRTQFQQLNSITVEGIMTPGVSLGDALTYLETEAAAMFPPNVRWDYAGQVRQFTQQGTALVTTFFLSLLVIYLVLAAQFESWRDPLIILVSVPMSIAGALIFVSLGFASINIYTQVGLITLIGLIAKNGILIVEFANQLRSREGLAIREAVEQAATVRLRPVLMTTVAMIVAMVPLLLATGPGAVSRFDIGLVIASGLGIGTLFTLFVVPAVYLKLARRERPSES
jgi:multidrug efflux pump